MSACLFVGVVLPAKDTLVKQPEKLAKMLLLLRDALEKAGEAESEAAKTEEATAAMDTVEATEESSPVPAEGGADA